MLKRTAKISLCLLQYCGIDQWKYIVIWYDMPRCDNK